jgi:hypothetical protein
MFLIDTEGHPYGDFTLWFAVLYSIITIFAVILAALWYFAAHPPGTGRQTMVTAMPLSLALVPLPMIKAFTCAFATGFWWTCHNWYSILHAYICIIYLVNV